MADPTTPKKSLSFHLSPRTSETNTSSTTTSDSFSSNTRTLQPVILTSANPISVRRYKNRGSFSQPLRPALYPPAKLAGSTPPQNMSGIGMAHRNSGSSQQSRESTYYAGSPIYPAKAKSVFKQHEDAVADIMSDIGQLQIFSSGDFPVEQLLASKDVPENATLLQEFRKGVRCGDLKSPVSSPAISSIMESKPVPVVPPRPKKLNRRSRKDSVKTPIHGGMISSPLEASMDVHPGEISRAVTVADGVLQYSPYESLRSYKLSQPTAEEEGTLSIILSNKNNLSC
ncbi:hypothetical protein L873DRAFT_652684 [Choiromyces venosus 120613-1]|uniref:Uncharacterized protein n=1 Tax=Choiromyces venosus 120613-1 TaxID=1336337 RepID=A0A3N4IUI9_9PEZI|nr:hypothetical protein L873DRAFT_652684 [Choiromyces venosus 120613-1]